MNTEDRDCGAVEAGSLSLADRWIRSRLGEAASRAREAFDGYRLDLAAQAVYEFTWHEFCDWYLELTKPVLQSGSEDEQRAW